jgi:hypothetical protein
VTASERCANAVTTARIQLATQAEEQRRERDRLATLNKDHAAETDAIATAGRELTRRAEQANPLTDLADAAAVVNQRLHALGVSVRVHVNQATAAAQQVSVAGRAYSVASNALETAEQAAAPCEEKASIAENDLTEADERTGPDLPENADGLKNSVG